MGTSENVVGKLNAGKVELQAAVKKANLVVTARKVEHIFGFQQRSLCGKFIRTVGILRACAKKGLMNLAYNMKRYVYLINEKTHQCHRVNSGKGSKTCILNRNTGTIIVEHTPN